MTRCIGDSLRLTDQRNCPSNVLPAFLALRMSRVFSGFLVISARRADRLLREKLFERVFAVRVRAFNRSYGGAELNMHLSLSQDMTPLSDFLQIMKDKGVHGVPAGIERGTI